MHYKSFLQIFISFIVIVLAQPDWSITASVIAASFGYALFFFGIQNFSNKKRALIAFMWMLLIQAIQLSWLMADAYFGVGIYVVLAFVCISIALQWSGLSLFIDRSPWAVASIWVLIEWSRTLILCGYPFNPLGYTLTSTTYSAQLLSIGGMYGLSFIVILTNLLFYHYRTRLALGCALLPYVLGGMLFYAHHHRVVHAERSDVLLVQAVAIPEEVDARLWNKLCTLMAPYYGSVVDLIVFSENVLPYAARDPVYPLWWVDQVFEETFGEKSGLTAEKVSNADIAHALAYLFDTTLIIGLEDGYYNSAICCASDEQSWYNKQVLLPFGEYIPFPFTLLPKSLVPCGHFKKGKETKVFSDGIGISICYEEMFGHLMRKNRLKGAKMLVNISNDVWYPSSRLPMVHYQHGRLRAIEMGVPMVRACNTGLTCGVDATGKLVDALPPETRKAKAEPGVLQLSLPMHHYPTLYTYTGDYLVLGLIPLVFLRKKRRVG